MPNARLKCKHCKEYKPRETIKRVNSGNFCGDDCILRFALANRAKGKAKIRQHERKELRKKKAEVRPISHDKQLTQTAFNKMRVAQELLWFKGQGLAPYCISCQKTNMDWCCGHFKTVGAQSGLRYDVKNTDLQCNRYCNKALSGNIEGNKNTIGYKKGLAFKFGEAEAAKIIEYCETNTQPKKWTKEELTEMRKQFNAEYRRIKKLLEG